MSIAEILSELPRLSREERKTILNRLHVLDGALWIDESISGDERREIDGRLEEARSGETQWSSWDEAKKAHHGSLNQG